MSNKLLAELIREYVEEALLVEHKLASNDVTLYHRSQSKLEVGDTLRPMPKAHGASDFELSLEHYRRKHFPSLPSRLSCVYASLVPRSRFLGKGILYAVKPLGRTHVTDSKIIDALSMDTTKEDKQGLLKSYWEGVDPSKSNIQDIEVLMSSAEVIEVVDESDNRLKDGMTLEFTETAPTINVELPYIPLAQQQAISKALSGMHGVKNFSKEGVGRFNAVVGPGLRCTVLTVTEGTPGATYEDNPMYVALKVGDGVPKMVLKRFELAKFMRAFRAGKIVKAQ